MKSILAFIVTAVLLIMGCAHYFEDASNSEIILPTVKEFPALLYPKTAQQNNYMGITAVHILVSKDGSVLGTEIYQSSGYSVLDSAAMDYCERVTFNPAMMNGIPVNSKTIFTIKFSLSNQESFERSYISKINELYDELAETSETEKFRIQKEILFKHQEFLGNVPEGSNPNSTVMKVISDDLTDEWGAYKKSCPLTFLVYHDFLRRFPDYYDISNVKSELNKAVNNDLKALEKIPIQDFKNPLEKDKLSALIRNFIKMKYPDLNINDVINQAINSY
jgi:TonB family protein